MKQIVATVFSLFMFSTGFSQTAFRKVSEEIIVNDAPFKACHASSIVETSPGEILVAFFAGSREGDKDVCIWLTAKQNNQWTKPYIIADGVINDTLRYPCWNPVLFKAKQDQLFLFYKVGPNPREWWGMVRTSKDNGKTWNQPERLPAGVLGPIKNKPVQLADGTILSPSSVETDNTWKVHIEKSSDLGKTWKIIPVDSNSKFKVIQPSILQYPNKRLQIVCRSDQDRVVYAWSQDNGNQWTALSRSELPNPNSGTDAVTLKNGIQLIVYNPTVKGKDWWNNRQKLNVAVSKDGLNWKDVCILENGTDEEFSYPAVIQAKDGKIHITYTYNRKNIKHVVLEAGK
jgi:predicted neuraminidase